MIHKQLPNPARIGLPVLILLLALAGFGASSSVYADVNGSAATGVQSLESIQSSFRAVAQNVIPAVVEIDVVDVVKRPVVTNPFEFFFGPQGRNSTPKEQEFKQYGLGSGVIVRRDGNKVYVLTNNHVVGEAEEISVKLSDQRQFTAKLVGTDARKDLALVVFETKESVPIASLGSSDALQVGDWVLAVGNPLGFSSTITSGIVSALGRHSMPGSNAASFTDYIQTDAAINQGNSGGALVNIYGEVVGINTWIASPSGGNVGLGFAIPINDAKKDIEDLLSKGKVEYGWLGAYIGNLPQDLAADMKLAGVNGAFVSNIFKDSPADKAGLQPGDYVTALNGISIDNANQLLQMVGNLRAGERARFELIRDGSPMSVSARIAARGQESEISKQANRVWPGLYITDVNQDIRKSLELPASKDGVVVAAVEQGSASAVAGLRQGDVIESVNGKNVKNISDFYSQINTKKNTELSFRIFRQGVELVVGLVS
jgi:Do/DeqQ family serine protease